MTAVMGVGSVIFHATLRYPAQLLDELPLYAMALLAAAVLRQRGARTAGVQPFVAVWCCFLAGSILGSERLTAVHTTMRGVMSVTFALAFVYIFTAANLAASEVDKARRPSMYPIHVVHHMHTYIASHVQCIWTLCVLSALLATISPFALRIHLYPCTHPPTHPGARRHGRRVSLPRHLRLLRRCDTRVEERRDPLGCAEQGSGQVGPRSSALVPLRGRGAAQSVGLTTCSLSPRCNTRVDRRRCRVQRATATAPRPALPAAACLRLALRHVARPASQHG